MPQLPRIKVCGVTREQDLLALASAGVDTVGFNFVPRSPRCLADSNAEALLARARSLGLQIVAVVMDMVPAELQSLVERFQPDFVQLHGSESPSMLDYCGGIDVIKAVSWSGRVAERELAAAWSQHAQASLANPQTTQTTQSVLRAFLVDAYAPAEGGGTGRQARWDLLLPRPTELRSLPLILAGGLNAENVADAIVATQADAVDTASGVEDSPGLKNPEMLTAFASKAAAAFR